MSYSCPLLLISQYTLCSVCIYCMAVIRRCLVPEYLQECCYLVEQKICLLLTPITSTSQTSGIIFQWCRLWFVYTCCVHQGSSHLSSILREYQHGYVTDCYLTCRYGCIFVLHSSPNVNVRKTTLFMHWDYMSAHTLRDNEFTLWRWGEHSGVIYNWLHHVIGYYLTLLQY